MSASTKTTPKASKPTLTHIHPITPEPCPPQLLSPDPSPASLPPYPNSASATSDSVPVLPTLRRRSLRLLHASQVDFTDSSPKSKPHSGLNGNCSNAPHAKVEEKTAPQLGAPAVGHSDNEQMGLDSVGTEIRDSELEEKMDQVNLSNEMGGNGSASGQRGSSCKAKGKREFSMNVELNSVQCMGDEGSKGFLSLRSGKRVLKRGLDSANPEDKIAEKLECRGQNDVDSGNAVSFHQDNGGAAKRGRKMRKEDKGKRELAKDDLASTELAVGSESVDKRQSKVDRKRKRKLGGSSEKGVVIENVDEGPSFGDLLPHVTQEAEAGLESNSGDNRVPDANHLEENAAAQDQEQLRNTNTWERGSRRNEYMERFRDIARENASRYAHFADEEHDPSSNEAQVENEIEDWPGPFSTAMKIIKDRASKSMQTGSVSSERSLTASIKWVPKRNQGQKCARILIPSLRELCLNILAKNADAIVSLDNVPDALKHKLSQLLCDSRKMNSHFFELLVSGSPTEIRLRDCSWMTEEQFTKSFQKCNTSGLVVLQLDQCGRCLPDYVLLDTLAQAPRYLPRLTSLSLSGACRLSDEGLHSLAASTPALRSINLSLCSLITSSSLYILADSLGSLLKELYLDDCQSIDAALIVPALMKLENLEVLSVAGIPTVCDDFIKDYIIGCGHNMKELVLKDCVKLTDSSMKVVAEHCPGLRALDLTNLSKLTDSSMVYLTNGCQALHMLKLCRNSFSDEAIAAFLETSGESLKELSLNNVKKVGDHTALSLASHAKKLCNLDLSWCRNLTDPAVGLIVDSCLSLRLLKLFGCTQITDVFLNGHSNPDIRIIGLKMSPVLQHVKVPDTQQCALHYSSVSL